MTLHRFNYKIMSFLAFFLVLVVLITSCEKKTVKPAEQKEETTQTPSQSEEPADNMQEMQKEEPMPDLTGKWTGTFDQRAATLNIKEQSENKFSGSLTVAYRNPLIKAVSGELNMDDMKFTMMDTEHSRYKGKYSGTYSSDGKMKGTFTMDLDGKNYSFSLTKR